MIHYTMEQYICKVSLSPPLGGWGAFADDLLFKKKWVQVSLLKRDVERNGGILSLFPLKNSC